MAGYEPSSLEITLTLSVGTLISDFYRGYVNRLPLTGSERVLDFGSGSGVCSHHLAARLERGGGSLTCVDVSRGWLAVARRTLRKYRCVSYCQTDLSAETDDSGLPESGFDVLFIHFVLHDLPASDRATVARRLASKLVPGGALYLREPLEPGNMGPGDFRQLLTGAGFVEINARRAQRWYTGPLFVGVFRK